MSHHIRLQARTTRLLKNKVVLLTTTVLIISDPVRLARRELINLLLKVNHALLVVITKWTNDVWHDIIGIGGVGIVEVEIEVAAVVDADVLGVGDDLDAPVVLDTQYYTSSCL